jgi:hypothetical protein
MKHSTTGASKVVKTNNAMWQPKVAKANNNILLPKWGVI